MLRAYRRFIGQFLWTLVSLLLTLSIVFGAIYAYMEFNLPDVTVLKDVRMQVPLRVYSSDGKLMEEYGAKRRAPVSLDQVPKELVDAILATEDSRFYEHPGVDFIAIVRSAIAVIATGHKVEGASTITMQVARNFFLTPKKTYTRKIKEILLAIKIDQTFSKRKILELYLNKVYFGNRAYGVAAAAHVYYGKSLDQLTLPQMAMIAGLPQAPSRNNPLANPKGALLRRNHVLKRMLDVGYINKETYENAIKAPITAEYHDERIKLDAPYVAEMVRQVLFSMYGERAYDSGLKVYTTLSSKLQNDATLALQQGLMAYSNRHGYRKPTENLGLPNAQNEALWKTWLQNQPTMDDMQPAVVLNNSGQQVSALLSSGKIIIIPWAGLSWARPALFGGYVGVLPKTASDVVSPGDVIYTTYLQAQKRWQLTQVPKVQGAFVALNPKNGAILALQGGFDFQFSPFNRVLQAERQPGSSFKPFLYSAAFAKGFTLATTINDAPIMMRDSGENAWWRPENDTQKFYGPTRLRVALAQSRNLVSIRLLRDIGVDYALNYIQRFGLDSAELPHSLSLALGSGVITPMQEATGYAVFANGGYRVTPFFIEKIETDNGRVLFQQPLSNPPEVITPQNAYLITQGMREVIRSGTGEAAEKLGRTDLAGKTGTTNHEIDAWFSGFNSDILATVWVGFDNHEQSLREYGAEAALPIWMQFMKQALNGVPESTMPRPADIVTARIDAKTGLLATPSDKDAIFEVFQKQFMPTMTAQNVVTNSNAVESSELAQGDKIF